MSADDAAVVNHLQQQLDVNGMNLSPVGQQVLYRHDFIRANYELGCQTATMDALMEVQQSLEAKLQQVIADAPTPIRGITLPELSDEMCDAVWRLYSIETTRTAMQNLVNEERTSYRPKQAQQTALEMIEKTMPMAFRQREIDLAMVADQSFGELAKEYRDLRVQHGQALGKEAEGLLGDLANVSQLIANYSKQHMLAQQAQAASPPLP